MKITNGIEMLEITANIMGKATSIYPTVFINKDSIILVDAGYPNQIQLFLNAFNALNISFEKLSKIIITHHDVDHIGSLSQIINKSTRDVAILTHEIEKLYIEGEQPPIKLANLKANFQFLPEQMKTLYNNLKSFYDNNKINVDKTIEDCEVLPYCGGITVIHTPGHTPGHICLYHNKSKTLIAGDALTLDNGELTLTPSSINYDQKLYIESLKKLAKYDIESVICYHGGLYKGNVSKQILNLAESKD